MKTYVHIKTYTLVHSSSIHNSPKLEMTQLSIHAWMDKQTVGHSYDGMLPGKKKGWSLDTHKNMDESQKTQYPVKEDRLKKSEYILHDSIYRKL